MKRLVYLFLCALCAVSCVYPFEADVASATGNLVVEGDIIIGGTSYFKLSRLSDLNDWGSQPELAYGDVYVEASDGTKYPYAGVTEDKGYEVPLISADPDLEYRLVANVEGREYVSEWSAAAGDCVIDDLRWQIVKEPFDQLNILMSIHSDDGTRHFRYRYSEVWEYHSWTRADCYYVTPDASHRYGQIVKYPYGENIYYCWKYNESAGINQVSTGQMSEDRLKDYQILNIGPHDNRLSTLYKITLEVFPISYDSYKFYENLKDVSFSTGSLFAPMPNAMRGNIRCSSSDEEMVYGYVDVIKPTTKTLYIECTGEVDKFYQRTWSNPDFKEENPGESDWYGYYRMGYLPYANDPMMGSSWARKSCIDCRLAGGTKTRPDDWPNDHK